MFERDSEILRVARDADLETIRRSFIKLTHRYPPEHFPEKFKEIKNSYERLTLNWDSIKPQLRELAASDTPNSMHTFLLQDYLQQTQTDDEDPAQLQFDLEALEPVLNTASIRKELFAVVQAVNDQGLAYQDPGDENC